MTKWVLVGLLVVWSSVAHAFNLRTGSWGYEYPWHSYGAVVPDGQSLSLTGGQSFSFNGVITDYWIDVGRPGSACTTATTICLNWYTGASYCNTAGVCTAKGVGATGTAMWNGATYTGVGAGSRHLRFYTYGTMSKPTTTPPNGSLVTRTKTLPIVGAFEHDGANTPISGQVLVTATFERITGGWEVEEIEYDVVQL